MPAGRPNKYKPEYCEELIEFMAQGYTFKAYAGHIKCAYSTVKEWVHKYPEFGEAKKIGQMACEKALLTIGRGLATGKVKGNAQVWMFMMRNICKWTNEITIKDEKTLKAVTITLPESNQKEVIDITEVMEDKD